MSSTLQVAAFALAASMLLSGCFLRSLVAAFDGDGGVSMSGNVQVKRCEEIERNVCTYKILDGNGHLELVSSMSLILDYGFAGVIIDPLIVQVPEGASRVTATYNNAGTPLPLVISEVTEFPVTPSMTITAEPATKFLILELPDAEAAALPPEGGLFDFSLDFVVAGPADFAIKPMLTASVDQADTRYYLPLLPCVTDFAQVPSVQLAQPTSLQDLLPQVRDLAVANSSLVCNGATYDLRAAGAATTSTMAPTTTSTSVAPTTTVAATSTVPATVPATMPTETVDLTTQLPETGSTTAAQLLLAFALLALGALVTWFSRRRPARP